MPNIYSEYNDERVKQLMELSKKEFPHIQEYFIFLMSVDIEIHMVLILQNLKGEDQEKQQLIQIHKIDHLQAAAVLVWRHHKL